MILFFLVMKIIYYLLSTVAFPYINMYTTYSQVKPLNKSIRFKIPKPPSYVTLIIPFGTDIIYINFHIVLFKTLVPLARLELARPLQAPDS